MHAVLLGERPGFLTKMQDPALNNVVDYYFSEGSEILKEMSTQWSLLPEEEKGSWNDRAREGIQFNDKQKKKVIRDLLLPCL